MKNAIMTMTTAATMLCLSAAVHAGVRYSKYDTPFMPKSAPAARAAVEVSVMPGKNMPLVAAKINGKACTLLFDTGATHTTLDAGFMQRELPDVPLVDVLLGGMTNVKAAPKLAHIASLELGEAKFCDFDAMVLDLADMARGIGANIVGVIGMNVIGSAPVIVSLGAGKAVFAPDAGDVAGFGKGIARYVDEPMSVALTPIYNGRMFPIIVDSGATMTFLDKTLGWPSSGEKVDIGAVHVNGHSGLAAERGLTGKLTLGEDVELSPMLIDQRASSIGSDVLLSYDILIDREQARFRKRSKSPAHLAP